MEKIAPKALMVFILLIINLFCFIFQIKAQNVAITDDDGYTAKSSAILDIKSDSKGLLIPRLTTAVRTGMTSPERGLLVFDSELNGFFYYDGSEWLALSTPIGVGEALFAVKNAAGDTIFAVYNDGVKVVVPYGTKGKVGGFAVSGRSPGKTIEEQYLLVTPDSTRVFVNELDVKGKVGGFAVSGRSPGKSILTEYFISTADSTRVYVNDTLTTKGKVGGFAVSGRSPGKGIGENYMEVTRDSTRIYVTEGLTKGKVGGFAVSGRSPGKAGDYDDYFNITGKSTAEIIKDEPRIMWYPVKSAFLAGEVHVGSVDSVGENSTALGYRTIAMGNYSQAMGYNSQSLGLNSTAIGNNAISKSTNSFAFGDSAQATNLDSYAFGAGAVASGIGSYAIGSQGRDTLTLEPISASTKAEGEYSFAVGQGAYAKGNISTSIGNNTTAEGRNSLALGSNTLASGNYSTAIGIKTIASGAYATAMGYSTKATNNYSTAIGINTTASGGTSFAAGAWTTASGGLSIATGYSNTSSGYVSLTLGKNNKASGDYSIAAGSGSAIASGNNAVAIGEGAVAQAYNSMVIGRYNVVEGNMTDWIVTDPLFVIGYGQSHSKANALTVLKNGYVGIGTSAPTEKLHTTGGVRFAGYTGTGIRLVTVDPDGNISTTGGTSENITWDAANGRLGIGIKTPTRTLHLYNSTADGQLLIQRYTNTLGDAGAILFKSHISTTTGYEKGGIFFETTNTAYGYGSLHFAINNTASNAAVTKADARMTITSSGNVGVGTTNPSQKLTVNGNIQLEGGVRYIYFNGGHGYLTASGSTSNLYFRTGGDVTRMVVNSSGNVGIGTNSPVAKLDINGSIRIDEGTTFSKMQGGTFVVGTGLAGVNTRTITFSSAFSSIPKVIVTVRTEDGYAFNDVFVVTTKQITTTDFKINIYRVDSPGSAWGQNLQIDWFAWN